MFNSEDLTQEISETFIFDQQCLNFDDFISGLSGEWTMLTGQNNRSLPQNV